MNSTIIARIVTSCAAASALILLAAPASAMPVSMTMGMLAGDAAASRTIVIKAGTRNVNVDNGETVRFDVDGKSFAYTFNTFGNETAFDLSAIAPGGFAVPAVRVYVAHNPLYRG